MTTPILTGHGGAAARIRVLVDYKPVVRDLDRMARKIPQRAYILMGQTAQWWASQAIPRLPVRASRNESQKRAGKKGSRYRRVGRGMLKKSTSPFCIKWRGDVHAGITSRQRYAIWLAAGTRRIAKGKVMRWRPGAPLVTRWPAKRMGGNLRGAMPIILPWQHKARNWFYGQLKKEFD